MTKVTGRDRLAKRLAAIQGAPRSAIHDALRTSAEEITAMQKRLAPKKTGALANSIGYTFGTYRADNANVRGVAGGGGAGDPDLSLTIHAGDAKAYYAAFVEFGTSPHTAGGKFEGAKHPGAMAEPFFYPGYRAMKRRTKSRISRATTKSVRQAASQ
jgi:HK97 gp10 family phage protein